MATGFAVDERDFPEMTVLSVRTKDAISAMGKHIRGLFLLAKERALRPSGPLFAVYYEKPVDPAAVDYEMCVPVEGPPGELDKLREMGGDRCLHLRLRGSYSRFGEAYAALEAALRERGLEPSGPPREVYTRGPILGFMTFLPTMVTDIYFPVGGRAAKP